MPIYQFVCKTCELLWERFLSIDEFDSASANGFACPDCGSPLKRRFSFASKIDFVPHYSSSLGRYVNTKSEQKNALRELEIQTAERLGYEPKYALYDPRELSHTVTEEGMDDTYRHRVKTGQMEVRKWH